MRQTFAYQISHSANLNCSVSVYDPYTKVTTNVDLPISVVGTPQYEEYHINGIEYDDRSETIYITAASAQAYNSIAVGFGNYSNANYTGPNHVYRFNTQTQKVIADYDMAPVQAEFKQATGNLPNGYQDIAKDTRGNTYVITGFGGIFTIGDLLVVSDSISAQLITFDTTQSHPIPHNVSLAGLPANYRPLNADGLVAPKKYNGKIVLWADDFNGTSVYGSNDNWKTANFLGLVPSPNPTALLVTATVEIGSNLFSVLDWASEISAYPFPDITKAVDAFVQGSSYRM